MSETQDFEEGPDFQLQDGLRADLKRLGLLSCVSDKPGRTRAPGIADELFGENKGYGCEVIPPDLFEADMRHLAHRIVRSVYRMEPPRNPLMRAVYRMLARLADRNISASFEVITLGLLLGAAKVHGVKIKTHPRDLAKEVQVKYATLLAIRKAAIAELEALKGEGSDLGNLY